MWRGILIGCGFVHLLLSIMYIFVNLQNGVYELVLVGILFCSISSVNYCCLMMYIVYIAINTFTLLSLVGRAVQNQALDGLFSKDNMATAKLAFTIIIMLLVYYIAALVLCFYAYREFKGMLFDETGGSVVPRFGRRADYQQSSGSHYQGSQPVQIGGSSQPPAPA